MKAPTVIPREERNEHMSDLIEQDRPSVWTPMAAAELNESAWQTWLAKGRARDQQGDERSVLALKWAMTAVLLAGAAFWAPPAPYALALRLIVTIGAFALMMWAFRTGIDTFAVVFGVIVWVYNPIAPLFELAGNWQRAAVLATAIPLFLSIRWDRPRQVRK